MVAGRSFSSIAAIGLIASLPAHADVAGGDIVDQILRGNARPGAVPPPTVQETLPVATIAGPDVGPAATAPPLVYAPPPPAAVTPTPGPAVAPLAPTPVPLVPTAVPTPAPAMPAPLPAATMDAPDIIGMPPGAPPPELPVPPTEAARWGGFYAGANLGAGWTSGTSASTCVNSVTNTDSGCTILNEAGPNTSGVLGGVQLGYMTPVSLGGTTLMVGGELDLQGSGISGKQDIGSPIPLSGFPPCPNCTFHASQSINWFTTLRGRIGIPVDNVLLYATGGLIVGGLEASQRLGFTDSTANYSAAASTTKVGPTIGAGAELLVSGPWSVKLEALYYDLGKVRTVAEPMNDAFVNFSNTKTFAFRGGMIRLGVNVRLGDIAF